MCYKTVHSYLLALKFVSDWFVPDKIMENLDNTAFSNDCIIFSDIKLMPLIYNFLTINN